MIDAIFEKLDKGDLEEAKSLLLNVAEHIADLEVTIDALQAQLDEEREFVERLERIHARGPE